MSRDITVEDVLRWEPCEGYSEERIRELAKGLPERATALQVHDHLRGRIPDSDLHWILCHEELIDPRILRECACDWAERAMRLAGWGDARSWHAIDVSRRYARGEATEAELRVANAAARDANDTAADTAARDANDAAFAAAFAAEDSAAFAAEDAAAFATARAAHAAEDAAHAAAAGAAAGAVAVACAAARAAAGDAAWVAALDDLIARLRGKS